jgi:hypothetical protein
MRAALQSKQVAARFALLGARLSSFPQYWQGRTMSSVRVRMSASSWSSNGLQDDNLVSVIKCFETDGGVNYRSDRLI